MIVEPVTPTNVAVCIIGYYIGNLKWFAQVLNFGNDIAIFGFRPCDKVFFFNAWLATVSHEFADSRELYRYVHVRLSQWFDRYHGSTSSAGTNLISLPSVLMNTAYSAAS
jgi:hypothetical protein